MELSELAPRLLPFCRDSYQDPGVTVTNLFRMPGHAGFSYGFSVLQGDREDKWYLRLPPPNVKLEGTADVMRQVAVLDILPHEVPHCPVRWSGSDERWFGRPYFIVEQLEGDVVRSDDDWVAGLEPVTRRDMARQAIEALAAIHRVDWRQAPYLGAPVALKDDVTRWDRFVAKAADPERLALVPEVRKLLLAGMPDNAPVGIFHGDFQWSNLFFARSGALLAVIDWELVGVGATLNDLGWFATFNDPAAWADSAHGTGLMPQADELIAMYGQASPVKLDAVDWYRALAAYKFAIITGFNLMLHRRGKRHDPLWEVTRESMGSLLERARGLLQGQK